MAFGQASGPPAPAKLVAQLEAQLNEHGFASFKEARHPFGLTQRQAAGRFTSAEANELMERLAARDHVRATEPEQARPAPPRSAPAAGRARPRAAAPPSARDLAKEEELVTGLTADVMATELTNRGWCCIPPE